MTLQPLDAPLEKPSYLEKVNKIIMGLPEAEIRKFPYLFSTKSANSKHTEACTGIYKIIEEHTSELETKLIEEREKYESVKKMLMGTCTSKELEDEAYEREEISIREAEAEDSAE